MGLLPTSYLVVAMTNRYYILGTTIAVRRTTNYFTKKQEMFPGNQDFFPYFLYFSTKVVGDNMAFFLKIRVKYEGSSKPN